MFSSIAFFKYLQNLVLEAFSNITFERHFSERRFYTRTTTYKILILLSFHYKVLSDDLESIFLLTLQMTHPTVSIVLTLKIWSIIKKKFIHSLFHS